MRRAKRSGRRENTVGDEPRPEGDDWEEHGGELMWVVGYTGGGAPYGLTVDELRAANAGYDGAAGWARAKLVLRELLVQSSGSGSRAEIGWVQKIAHGMSREVFAADVELGPECRHRSGRYVVLLPRSDADDGLNARVRTELQLLQRLTELPLAFRLPELVGAFPDSHGLALVRRFVAGVELDLRAGRQPGVRPCETLAEIMAELHRLDGARFADILPGSTTRREHALEALRVLNGLDDAVLREARSWAEAHLPPAEPSALLHGDLLGQNILLAPDDPPTVIDWEFARRGDPAYDMAIVTRGVRRPFQLEHGLEKLLEAYHRHGDARVTLAHVTLYEMCLVAGWYRESLASRGARPPHEELARLRSLLRRVEGGVD